MYSSMRCAAVLLLLSVVMDQEASAFLQLSCSSSLSSRSANSRPYPRLVACPVVTVTEYFLYELETTTYMLEPWEKVLFSQP
jgi:hypothetical protein